MGTQAKTSIRQWLLVQQRVQQSMLVMTCMGACICAAVFVLVAACGESPYINRENLSLGMQADKQTKQTSQTKKKSAQSERMSGETVLNPSRFVSQKSSGTGSGSEGGTSSSEPQNPYNNPNSPQESPVLRQPIQENSACNDKANFQIEIGSEVFFLAERYDQLIVQKDLIRNIFKGFFVNVSGLYYNVTPSFRFRALISGVWFRHSTMGHNGDDLVFKFVRATGNNQRYVYIQPVAKLTSETHNGTDVQTYRMDMGEHDACIATYKNAAGDYFSGGAPIILLPKTTQAEHYLRSPPL